MALFSVFLKEFIRFFTFRSLYCSLPVFSTSFYNYVDILNRILLLKYRLHFTFLLILYFASYNTIYSLVVILSEGVNFKE